jgi:steroid delta-isomerase-like uncharacterized protein
MTEHPLRAVIDAYNAAWSRHDIDAILEFHTEDSVFENHTSGGKAEGHDAIRALLSGVFETFPDLTFGLRRIYVRDDLVVQEWTATATHSKPVKHKDTVLAPTGKTIRWDGMDIFPIREGKIARKDVYASSLDYLRQLGAPV